MAARRSWPRRLGALFVAALVLAGVLGTAAWQLTPSVSDAQARIALRLAVFGANDPGSLPVPDRVGQAVIATEDATFTRNPGLSASGMYRYVTSPVTGDAGSATLEQQLAKVLYSNGSQALPAQAEDAVLAVKLDAGYTKDQVLQMYLAAVYFGHGFYGLSAAARGYFGLAPADLSWAQASLLAGLVQAPSAYDPLQHLDLAVSRQGHVLDRLVATGVLSAAQATAARTAPLGLHGG
ncbi:transglycosylase domain-containing protein [Rhodococcus antarcticus]|uniref:Transglycosylase domain-containing protein n=1 Tax=Rhodococcus antarcticus TaxID=2987751 RepID=A0ABY6P0K1_9NOCA|nr:biosynthetic peptidoglycan transglycosylase [Rhodococcus antarcticus]UZJ25184.1 transglycosylase domain-containing protein [Rhodococcus antarcticus]